MIKDVLVIVETTHTRPYDWLKVSQYRTTHHYLFSECLSLVEVDFPDPQEGTHGVHSCQHECDHLGHLGGGRGPRKQ